tara:strand:+ start:25176 stop:26186 length:1011 start_codon:yes stop_codon:yes gene_type:complete
MKVNSNYNVSIVIPLSNGSQYISDLFRSISKQTLQPKEIIFVISKIGNWELAINKIKQEKNFITKIIFSDPIFPGAARNLGAKNAEHDLIAFLDIRTLPTEDWLEQMIKKLFDDSSALVIANMICSSSSFFHHVLKAATYGERSVECLPGSVVKKSSFLSSNGFLEHVRAGEDWEWINRFHKTNKISKQQKIVINYHGLPDTFSQLINKWFIYSFENSKVSILLKEKFSYMGLAFIIFSILLYRWNHIVSGEVWNEDAFLFIPNLNKIFWSIFLFCYFLYRGIFKPLSNKVNTQFLFPGSWVFVGAIGFIIDLVKAPGRIHGSIMHLYSFIDKERQ